MKKLIFNLLFFLVAVNVSAQLYPTRAQMQPNTGTGINNNNGAFKNLFYIPNQLKATPDSGAIAYYNKKLWIKNDTGWIIWGAPVKINDSTYILSGDTLTIKSGNGAFDNSIATGSREATGNWTQNWKQRQLYIDSVLGLRFSQYGPLDFNPQTNYKFNLIAQPNTGSPLKLDWGLNDVNGDDSSYAGMQSNSLSTLIQQYGNYGATYSAIEIAGGLNIPYIGLESSYYGSRSSVLVDRAISIIPADSVIMGLTPTANTDSIVGISKAFNVGGKMVYTLKAIPRPPGVLISNAPGTAEVLLNTLNQLKRLRSNNEQILTISSNNSLILLTPDSTYYMCTNSRLADTAKVLRALIAAGGGGADSSIYATRYYVDTGKVNIRTAIDGKQPAGNYVTGATGDISFTGPGNVTATINSNVVTDSKLRQSVGRSVIGRSAGTTGNVADITATLQSTYLTYGVDGTLKFDSTDYAHIKNKPNLQNPGVYFSPAISFDPTFVVFASAIIYPNNAYSFGQPIIWKILDAGSLHNSSFIDSAGGDPSTHRLLGYYPQVRMVLNTTITPDESFSSRCVMVGPSVGLTSFQAPISTPGSLGIRLVGNGTTTWDKNYLSASKFDVEAYNTGNGRTRFDVPTSSGAVNYDPDGMTVIYTGSNGYRTRRVYSALGSYTSGFILEDQFGNPVLGAPTTSDEVYISSAATLAVQVDAHTYNASNAWFADNMNFWVFGTFECYMVASPTSSTSTLVRWQTNFPSATNYKIYRSTSKYGARTLIHTGLDGKYIDTGLTPGTLYYYHLIGTVGGVDQDITYFTTNTNNN